MRVYFFNYQKDSQFLPSQKSFTLIEVIIATAIVTVIFLGILGAYQLGLKVIAQSRNKITATAIANQQIELIRNLPYHSIGIKGGFPDGSLDPVTTTIRNNISYKVESRVDYIVDTTDGIAAPEDECPNDYKIAEIRVSWAGRFRGEVVLTTNIAPQNLSEECAERSGILSISVFDAYGIMIPSSLIEVRNPATDQLLKTATPDSGKHYFSLATSTYKVVVLKDGYSTDRSYGTDEITTPERPHPTVLEGQVTEISFSIDKLSSFSIDTLSPYGQGFFSDSFADETKISTSSSLSVANNEVTLATDTQGYLASGYLISGSISPSVLINWEELSWSDLKPRDTEAKYQLLYASGTEWNLIPDQDLPGNSGGFDISPVDLSGISVSAYPKLKIKGNLSTADSSSTPIIYNWQLSWINSIATPIPNVPLKIEGSKIIGTNSQNQPVYKYSITSTSNSGGHLNVANLEWDLYSFSLSTGTSLSLVGTTPSPQPINLVPDTNLPVSLYLEAQNWLLVTVQNIETLEPVFAASLRLYNIGSGYDVTQYTNENGQTYFIPLEPASYHLEIEAPGFAPASTTLSVSGHNTKIIKLEQIE